MFKLPISYAVIPSKVALTATTAVIAQSGLTVLGADILSEIIHFVSGKAEEATDDDQLSWWRIIGVVLIFGMAAAPTVVRGTSNLYYQLFKRLESQQLPADIPPPSPCANRFAYLFLEIFFIALPYATLYTGTAMSLSYQFSNYTSCAEKALHKQIANTVVSSAFGASMGWFYLNFHQDVRYTDMSFKEMLRRLPTSKILQIAIVAACILIAHFCEGVTGGTTFTAGLDDVWCLSNLNAEVWSQCEALIPGIIGLAIMFVSVKTLATNLTQQVAISRKNENGEFYAEAREFYTQHSDIPTLVRLWAVWSSSVDGAVVTVGALRLASYFYALITGAILVAEISLPFRLLILSLVYIILGLPTSMAYYDTNVVALHQTLSAAADRGYDIMKGVARLSDSLLSKMMRETYHAF